MSGSSAQRFGSLHFIPQSEALDAELLRREMEEAAAAAEQPGRSEEGGSKAGGGGGGGGAHSSVRDNTDTTNGYCGSAVKEEEGTSPSPASAAASTNNSSAAKSKSAQDTADKKSAEAGGDMPGEDTAAVRRQREMCRNDDDQQQVEEEGTDALDDESLQHNSKSNNRKEEKEEESGKSCGGKNDVNDGGKATTAVSSNTATDAAAATAATAATDRSNFKSKLKPKDEDSSNTTTNQSAAVAAASAKEAGIDGEHEEEVQEDEKKEDHGHAGTSGSHPHSHGHHHHHDHGHHHGKHSHGHHHHHHGKKHPQAHAAEDREGGAVDAVEASDEHTNGTPAAKDSVLEEKGDEQQQQPRHSPRSRPDVRSWFLQTLTTGCRRSCASAVSDDPAFVDLFVELMTREKGGKTTVGAAAGGAAAGSNGGGNNGAGAAAKAAAATSSAAQYAPEELSRLYGEYHRAALAAAAAAAAASASGGGGGGKKKGSKNKAAAKAAAAAAATVVAAAGPTKDEDEAGPGSASTTAKAKDKLTDKGDAAETPPTGTTATTATTTSGTAAATATTTGSNSTSATATATATTADDDAYRIRGEGEGKDKDKADDNEKEEQEGQVQPKMIIQYKSGLVVPVTRTAGAGTNAGAAAATTRAVLAAAERTKNSPSSPSTGAAASAAALPIKDVDDGDIGSKPSFSALGGGGGGGSGGSSPAKAVNADAEEAAARELASSSAAAAELSSKKARKKAKKARQQANKVVRAKQAAAQAMGRQAQAQAQTSGGAGPSEPGPSNPSMATASLDQMELLRHVRIVMPSALGFASPGKNPPSGGQEWGKPFGPVLILEPDFVNGSPSSPGGSDTNAFLDLADRIVSQTITGASFLSQSQTDWTSIVSNAGGAISASVLLLARMESSIRAAHAAATGASSGICADDDDKDRSGTLASILATSSSSLIVAAGADKALQNALDLWLRIRTNENDEGVMLLSSKIHSDMHQDLLESYPFQLEDIIAAPLQLLSFSKAHPESTEWSRWWNATITCPLRSIKKEMQSIPVLCSSNQSGGRASSNTNGSSSENAGPQSTPSKSKKKKKKKAKKKKAAAAAAAAAAATESSGAVCSNVAEDIIDATSSKSNVPPLTPSGEGPSIKSSLSTDHSSADSPDLSHQGALQPQANATAATPIRGSITIGAGNNTVVGLGRMMEEEEHHDDGWETVPAKGSEKRNNNNAKKSGGGSDNKGGGGNGGGRQQQNQQQQSPSPSKKKRNKSKAAKKKEQARRLVDDIISGILDNVEHEVDRRRRATLRAEGRRRANEERKKAAEAAQNTLSGKQPKSASLRDVVVGASSNVQPSVDRTSSMPNVVDGEDRGKKQKSRRKAAAGSPPTGRTPVSGVMPAERTKIGGGADTSKASVGQKTAPTLPDTVSGRSTSGGTRGRAPEVGKTQAPPTAACGVESSVSTDETATPGKIAATGTGTAQPPQDTSPKPPLPICNTVSASSSVASSLEAPHATRHRPRGRSHELKEDDVGYHLVKLCDKLSDEMAVFMERRAMALSIRRTERNALLGALQDAASKVFSGHARVETYGSCATQLDLPSSDLDVVICGLNDVEPKGSHQQGPPAQDGKGQQKGKNKKSKTKGGGGNGSGGNGNESEPKQQGQLSSSKDESSSAYVPQQQQQQQPPHPPPHYQQYPPQYYQYYPPPSPSGLKVLRLAAELEMHPWAVQVKAIPTATVPVIKLLADPTRVPGGAVWMMQPQHMPPVPMPPPQPQHQLPAAAQSQEEGSVVSEGQGHAQPQAQPQQPYYNGPAGAAPMPFIHPAAMPWRGADIMNGLISIDITFEGPEHGGIGSTIFSQAFVHEVCTESNLPPEATAAVQMIMVIKELLAQRRLNEPYSGGLSSFAVLLLAVSVIRERKLIQDEMRRMEKQRRAVEAAVEGPGATPKPLKSKKKASKQQNKKEATCSTNVESHKSGQTEPKGEKKDAECSASVTSTATPIAKATRAVKQESKHTQTDEGDVSTSGPVSSKVTASEKSESTKQNAPTKGTNDGQASEKSAPAKGSFSFKDALKGNAKPKPAPAKKDAGKGPAKQVEAAPKAPSGPKSWASIAKTKSQTPAQPQAPVTAESTKKEGEQSKRSKEDIQVSSATNQDDPVKADSDTEKAPAPEPVLQPSDESTRNTNDDTEAKQSEPSKKVLEKAPVTSASVVTDSVAEEQSKPQAPPASAAASAVSASASESVPARSGGGGAEENRRQLPFPQGSNDVLEVLCTGEPTAGKLLMHFLLFYGQHFESQATAVDVSGVHHPDFHRYRNRPYGSYRLSSYVPRHSGGSIDPVTGMYTVDPIVIYDPLEGCENNNVARSCFAWASIRSVFHQCYMTLSGACERGSGTNEAPVGIGGSGRSVPRSNRPSRSSSAESGKATDDARQQQNHHGQHHEDSQQQQVESVLALLLSF